MSETIGIHDRLMAMLPDRETPEGYAVRVVADTEKQAEVIGPMLAEHLFPDSDFRGVLHVEAMPEGGFEVVVEVRRWGQRDLLREEGY